MSRQDSGVGKGKRSAPARVIVSCESSDGLFACICMQIACHGSRVACHCQLARKKKNQGGGIGLGRFRPGRGVYRLRMTDPNDTSSGVGAQAPTTAELHSSLGFGGGAHRSSSAMIGIYYQGEGVGARVRKTTSEHTSSRCYYMRSVTQGHAVWFRISPGFVIPYCITSQKTHGTLSLPFSDGTPPPPARKRGDELLEQPTARQGAQSTVLSTAKKTKVQA